MPVAPLHFSAEVINEKTVYSWSRQGIPDKWKVAVSRCLLEDNLELSKFENLLPPGIQIENLISANNSIKIFSSSKVLKTDNSVLESLYNKKDLKSYYLLMLKIRRFEEKNSRFFFMKRIILLSHYRSNVFPKKI